MSTSPTPTLSANPKPGAIREHARAYAGTYLTAGLFVFVTLLQSFVAQFAEFKDYTSVQLSTVTFIRWAFAGANTLIATGVVILAFLNQTKSRADAKREARETATPFTPKP